MYQALYYNDLEIGSLKQKFQKTVDALQRGDFRSADVKKLKPSGYYRAKLDDTHRLLFMPASYEGQPYLLILEVIRNHAYQDSRFLRGFTSINESRIERPNDLKQDILPLAGKPHRNQVHCLDKWIVFDEAQASILQYPLPLIVIGSAGSGKTSVTLERLKTLVGDVLYVTLSNYLVQNTQQIYYAHHYENNQQNIDFLSFQEYIETIRIPSGKQITAAQFSAWLVQQKKPKNLQDAQKLFEEFCGVIAGADPGKPYLSREDYLKLGVKQSIYPAEERADVYALFERYLQILNQSGYYDSNILAYDYQAMVAEKYDAVVVDEVQDFTNSQLALVLKSLKAPEQFLLCGDANQIVHPNFFSWSTLKSYFYQHDELSTHEITRVLTKNYRNAPEVTELANRILRFKNHRFGSVDRESHYLVESTAIAKGHVACLQASDARLREMNEKTGQSTQCAVLVLHDKDKVKARKIFNTPLIFTVQEAKGLEYEHVVLYNFISSEKRYDSLCKGVDADYLDQDFKYGRAKQKTDKSLEIFKFYINALYVAVTRAVKNVYLLEDQPKHRFLQLLNVNEIEEIALTKQTSTREDWQREASKLSMQGKAEQAQAIEEKILQHSKVSWQIFSQADINGVLAQTSINKRDAILVLNYALLYDQHCIIESLRRMGIKAAHNVKKAFELMEVHHFSDYTCRKLRPVQQKIERYGLEFRNQFNFTPLMCAAYIGSAEHVKTLLNAGANIAAVDNDGRNAYMIALSRALNDSHWLQGKFEVLHEQLQPSAVSLQADNRLIKIDAHKSECFLTLLVACYSKQRAGQSQSAVHIPFRARDLIKYLSRFSDVVVPSYRKRQSYLNGLLARNEVGSSYATNRKLFVRLRVGVYILNPDLEWRVGGGWRKVLGFADAVAASHGEPKARASSPR